MYELRTASALAWNSVPFEVKLLMLRVQTEAPDIRFYYGEPLAWPAGTLRDGFASLSSTMLAGAALVATAHSLSSQGCNVAKADGGAILKFVEYADQTLRERYDLPLALPERGQWGGRRLWVADGVFVLHLDIGHKHGGYFPLGMASARMFDLYHAQTWPIHPGYDSHPNDLDRWYLQGRKLAVTLSATGFPLRGHVHQVVMHGGVPGVDVALIGERKRVQNGSEKRVSAAEQEHAGSWLFQPDDTGTGQAIRNRERR